MRLAAIDLGSNSVKLTCADVAAGGELAIAIDRETLSRIGEGVDRTGLLAEAAIERTLRALADDVAEARAFGAERIACVATAGLRGASNAEVLIDRARRELGLAIEVIDGDREAELAFQAVINGAGPGGPLTVVDIGGRSTEIITGSPSAMHARVSLELGSVRMTERHLAHEIPTDEELAALTAAIDLVLLTAPEAEGELFGVSGTALALASFELGTDDMAEVAARGDGVQLEEQTIRAAYETMRRQPARERIRGTAIPSGRADVVVAGALILLRVLHRYQRRALTISSRGLRHALLAQLVR